MTVAVSRRDILENFTKKRLLEITYFFELTGLSRKPWDEILSTLCRKRSIEAGVLLALPAMER